MFVQDDDVILNVDFFLFFSPFLKKVAFITDCSMHYYYYKPL